jgi:hypothetical protein
MYLHVITCGTIYKFMTFTQLVKLAYVYFNLFMCNIQHLVFVIIYDNSYFPCYLVFNLGKIHGLEIFPYVPV